MGRRRGSRSPARGQPGLNVLGPDFQYTFNSHTVGGVGKAAACVVWWIATPTTCAARTDRPSRTAAGSQRLIVAPGAGCWRQS